MKVIKIESGMFQTNSYVITNDNNEAIIIDPTFDFYEESIKLKSKYQVKAILLTHAHLDHIDGIRYFLDVPIYISKEELYILNDPNNNLYMEFFGNDTPFDTNKLNLNLIEDEKTLNLIGYDIEVIKTPGHTIGGLSYKIDNYLFTGDTLFKNSIGRWDFPTGNYHVLMMSIKKLITKYKENLLCYPGHDDSSYLDDIKKYNPYVLEVK